MDQETVGNVVLLVIVTLISVVQNAFFAHKVEHESKTQNGRSFQRTGTLAFERVYTANSCCLRGTDVFACEAKVLRGLSGRENSEHPWLHIRQADHPVSVPHVPCRSTQPLPHLLLRKRLRELHKNCNHNHLASASHPLIAGCRVGQSPDQ
ncbi:arachidonate 5-lipoxygenase-activating protein isoform X2 [Peromyscus californicus insignis]|uniref:arachidonate 5-lipoxygenase-activating protein isoform X2 n=1 Tax=Peromyscus californicus insignis TaxID=564181 RepID=UPI0022A68E21|nr:arachidonate 5-lipoxygenase-activating protein isoform X2 [Peromyscus californicus insignis]